MPAKNRRRRSAPKTQPRGVQPALRTREEDAKHRRRAEAQRLRETTRRRTARRRRYRAVTYWIVGIVAVAGLAFVATRSKHAAPLSAAENLLLSEAPAQAQAAG